MGKRGAIPEKAVATFSESTMIHSSFFSCILESRLVLYNAINSIKDRTASGMHAKRSSCRVHHNGPVNVTEILVAKH
jgi:hypothetical protein